MSRIGKKPVPLPKGVQIKLVGDVLSVSGPKGELRRRIHPKVRVEVDPQEIRVVAVDSSKEARALHGLFRVLVANMVTGVTDGFQRVFEIVGVGYRAEIKGRTAIFNLGYSHPIHFDLPDGIDARVDRNRLTLTGIDHELLGQTAAKIRNFRRPEPYKGKGVKFADEVVRRKAGKAGAK